MGRKASVRIRIGVAALAGRWLHWAGTTRIKP